MGSDVRPDQRTRDELLDRLDRGWAEFRALAEAARDTGFDRRTNAGWTIGAMLAHVAAWHDATAFRLHRFAVTGQPQPKVEDDDDAFNARVTENAAGRADDDILADLDTSFTRLRAAIEALPAALRAAEDGWAEAVLAGNSFEHYEEHASELADAPTDGRSASAP
jgi:hypothetical protein